jgi:hypothetical protein
LAQRSTARSAAFPVNSNSGAITAKVWGDLSRSTKAQHRLR